MRVDNLFVICLNHLPGGVESVEPSAQALQDKFRARSGEAKTAYKIMVEDTQTPGTCSKPEAWKAAFHGAHASVLKAIAGLGAEKSVGIYISSHGYLDEGDGDNPYRIGAENPEELAALIAEFGFRRIDKISIVACNMRGDALIRFCKALHGLTNYAPMVASYRGFVTVLHPTKVITTKNQEQPIYRHTGEGKIALVAEDKSAHVGKKLIKGHKEGVGEDVFSKWEKTHHFMIAPPGDAGEFARRFREGAKQIKQVRLGGVVDVPLDQWSSKR